MSRSRKRKKKFPCGHTAHGQYCHACKQAWQQQELERQQLEMASAAKADRRKRWLATFENDPIDLHGLPTRIVKKSRKIIRKLSSCSHYGQLGGIKLAHSRDKIRIPVGRSYRLLCRRVGDGIKPVAVISHEKYNGIAKNTRR